MGEYELHKLYPYKKFSNSERTRLIYTQQPHRLTVTYEQLELLSFTPMPRWAVRLTWYHSPVARDMKKVKQYENLIWEAFGQNENYDKIRHQLIRIRDVMSDFQPSYTAMTAKMQFKYAQTILIIVTQSTTKDLRQFSLRKDKNEVFEYAVNEGFVPPNPIRILEQKLLS